MSGPQVNVISNSTRSSVKKFLASIKATQPPPLESGSALVAYYQWVGYLQFAGKGSGKPSVMTVVDADIVKDAYSVWIEAKTPVVLGSLSASGSIGTQNISALTRAVADPWMGIGPSPGPVPVPSKISPMLLASAAALGLVLFIVFMILWLKN